jgi:hypothetical protein
MRKGYLRNRRFDVTEAEHIQRSISAIKAHARKKGKKTGQGTTTEIEAIPLEEALRRFKEKYPEIFRKKGR